MGLTSPWTQIAAGAIIVAVVTLRAWSASHSWFFAEDLVVLSDVAHDAVSFNWILSNLNGEFSPLGRLAAIPVTWFGAFNWTSAAIQLVLLSAAAMVACWWAIISVIGVRPTALVPLICYGTYISSSVTALWWTAGVPALLTHIGVFVAIASFGRVLTREPAAPNRLSALTVVLSVVVAVAASPSGWLVIIVLVCFAGAATPPMPVAEQITTTWQRWRIVWAGLIVVAAGYLVAWLTRDESANFSFTSDPWSRLREAGITNFATSLFGGPWSWVSPGLDAAPRQLADPGVTAQVLAVVILAAATAHLVTNRPELRWVLALAAALIAVRLGFLLVNPMTEFGQAFTLDPRVWSTFMPYTAIVIALLIGPPRFAAPPARSDSARPARESSTRTSAPVFGEAARPWVLPATTATLVASALVSTISYTQAWDRDHAPREFLTTAISELHALSTPPVLAEDPVPGYIVPVLLAPYNQPDYLLAPIHEEFEISEAGNNLRVLNGDGLVVQSTALPEVTVDPVAFDECLPAGDGTEFTAIDVGQEIFDFPFWTSISYRAPASGNIDIIAGTAEHSVPLLAGRHILSFRTAGSFDSLQFAIDSAEPVCIDSMHIGQVMVTR